jgi:hypothetical protein
MSQDPAVPRVLVSYVDPLDATAQLAMSIAEQLCRHGIQVELRPVSRARPASAYRAVVVGGAVDNQHWDEGALDYVEHCHARPEQTWLFHTSFSSDATAPSPPPEVLRVLDTRRIWPVPTFGSAPVTADPQPLVTIEHAGRSVDPHEAARRWATRIAHRILEEDLATRTDRAGFTVAC